MEITEVARLLTNAGFKVLDADAASTQIYIEDPSCIVRNFETFIHYAWLIIATITAILLFGWAISKIRGANTDVSTNIRNLIIIFGTLSAVGPIVNTIYGQDLIGATCTTIQVPLSDVQELLDLRRAHSTNNENLYESIDIYDSGSDYNALQDDLSPIDVPDIELERDPDNPGEYIIPEPDPS